MPKASLWEGIRELGINYLLTYAKGMPLAWGRTSSERYETFGGVLTFFLEVSCFFFEVRIFFVQVCYFFSRPKGIPSESMNFFY